MPVTFSRLLFAAFLAIAVSGPAGAQKAAREGVVQRKQAQEMPVTSLPAPGPDIEYVARDRDTMIGIARRFLIDGNQANVQRALQVHNELRDADRISPGQVIRIPENWVRNDAGRLELVNVQGDVQLKGQPASSGAAVASGDDVRTGADGHATVKLADGSTLLLKPGTSVAVDTVRKSPLATAPEAQFTLKSGRVEASVPKRSGTGARFEVRTPIAVAAVRGTVFRVFADDDGKTATSEVLEGTVQVNDTGNLGSVSVPDGFGTKVAEASPPLAPRALLPAPRLWGGIRLVPRRDMRLGFTVLAGAVSYRLLIARRADFSDVISETILLVPEIVLPELEDGAYFVKVRGIDDIGLEGRDSTADIVVNLPR